MDRRRFIKALGFSSGLLACPSFGWSQEIGYEGPFFVHITAAGGWDTTLLCDPKGRLNAAEVNPINRTYHRDDIESPNLPSPITYAPTNANRSFFERHHQRLLILNGIDLATINHQTGAHAMGGGFGEGIAPSIGALLAASRAPELGLSFWSAGGYSRTNSHVVRTRISRSDRLAALTTPNYPAPFRDGLSYQPERDFERAMTVVRRRAERRAAATRLPLLRRGLSNFARSHRSGQGLDQLIPFLPRPEELDAVRHDMTRQIILGAASYQAGLTCAMAAQGPGSFDSHDNNDDATISSLSLWLDLSEDSALEEQ